MPDPQAEMRAFIEKGLDITLTPAECIGWGRDGELIAAVAFHNYYPGDGVIEITAFSTTRAWLSKDRLREIFAYPFEQLGVRIVMARIAEHNKEPRRFMKTCGAKEYVLPELWADGVAECLCLLHRRDWFKSKFMRSENGQKRHA